MAEIKEKVPELYYADDEVTLKDVIVSIQNHSRAIWKYKFWVILSALSIGLAFIIWASLQKTTYTSGLTFIINEGSDPSSALELSEVSETSYNLDRLIALARSSKITHEVLLTESEINGHTDLLLNHVIRIYKLKVEPLKRINDPLSENDKIALNKLHELIAGNVLTDKDGFMSISNSQSKPKNKSPIIRLSIETIDSELSRALLDGFFENLKNFYIDQTIGSSKRTLTLLVDREIQLKNELSQTEDQLKIEVAIAQNNILSTVNERFDLLEDLENSELVQQRSKYEIIRLTDELELNRLSRDLYMTKKENLLNAIKTNMAHQRQMFNKQQMLDSLKLGLEILESQKELAEENLTLISEYQENVRKPLENKSWAENLAILENELVILMMNNQKYVADLRRLSGKSLSEQDSILLVIKNDYTSDELGLQALVSETQSQIKINDINDGISDDLRKLIEEAKGKLTSDKDILQLFNEKIVDIRLDQITRRLNNLDAIYSNLIKNKQSLEFMIKYRTPDFQIIDQTIRPIISKASKNLYGLVGFILGAILSMVFIILRKSILEELK